MTITTSNFTSVNNDSYGNPRHVIHFLNVLPSNIDDMNFSINGKYLHALYIAKQFGGKKFHNKQYGGGIAFATYNLDGLIEKLNKAIA